MQNFRSLLKTPLINRSSKCYFGIKVEPISMSYTLFTNTDTSITEAPPIIIMHGLLGSKINWRSFSRILQERFVPNRKIFTVDARNHGESPHTSEHSYNHMAEDVVQLLKEQNINRAIVMGHSMGGKAMMTLALKYPNLVERAIFLDISPIYMPRNFVLNEKVFEAMKTIDVPMETSMLQGRINVEKHLRKVIDSEHTVSFISQNLKKLESGHFTWMVNVNSLQKNFSIIRGFPKELIGSQYRGPVLFIGGSSSTFINKSDWPKIKQFFPDATLEYVDSGHLVHFDAPQEVMMSIKDFLELN